MASDLDEILNGNDTDPVIQEDVTPVTVPEPMGVNEPVIETPATEVPPTPEPQEEKVPLAALMAERAKRQEIERKLAERPEQTEKPDFYADPEGYIQSARRQDRLEMSAALVESQHTDFKENLAVFLEEAHNNPILAAQLEAHPHPAMFAYEQAKRIKEFRAMQDMPAFLAKKEAEIEARIRAEYEQKAKAKQSVVDAIPPDLSGVRGSKMGDPIVNESLESILEGK